MSEQSPYAVRVALKAAIDALFVAAPLAQTPTPGVAAGTSYGAPGQYLADELVSLDEVRETIEQPTSGPGRSRDSTVEADILFSSYRAGGDEAAVEAEAKVYAMARQLEGYLGVSPQERLGGACYTSWVSNRVLDSAVVWQDIEDGTTVAAGRNAVLTVTVTARCRYAVGAG